MTKTDVATTMKISKNSKYAPTVKKRAINPADIAEIDISLLFIIYNKKNTSYQDNTT